MAFYQKRSNINTWLNFLKNIKRNNDKLMMCLFFDYSAKRAAKPSLPGMKAGIDIDDQRLNELMRVADPLPSPFSIIPDNINPQLFIP